MHSDALHLAARQHGVIARRQLTERGVSAGQVAGWVRRGRLQPLEHGVYLIAGAPTGPLVEAQTAVLRAGDGARVAGERLLAACGVRDAAVDGPFVVLTPPGRRLPAATFDWRPDRHPTCGTTAHVRGLPSWGPARNLLEAAVGAADGRVQLLADGVRRLRRHRMQRVHDLVLGHPEHVGGRRLLWLGCLDADAAESQPERVLEVLLREFRPERQVWLCPDLRVDLLLRRQRIVVEYIGRADHAGQHARVRDAARRRRIEALGYMVVEVTAEDLREPAALLRRIRALAAT